MAVAAPPFGEVSMQALPPEQKFAVRLQPFAQFLPVPDQCFVADFDQVGIASPAGHKQALAGENGNNRPVGLADFGSGRPAAGVLTGLAGPDRLEKYTAGGKLLRRVEFAINAVRIAGERAVQATESVVGIERYAARFPELAQDEFEQREIAGLGGSVVQKLIGECAVDR